MLGVRQAIGNWPTARPETLPGADPHGSSNPFKGKSPTPEVGSFSKPGSRPKPQAPVGKPEEDLLPLLLVERGTGERLDSPQELPIELLSPATPLMVGPQ